MEVYSRNNLSLASKALLKEIIIAYYTDQFPDDRELEKVKSTHFSEIADYFDYLWLGDGFSSFACNFHEYYIKKLPEHGFMCPYNSIYFGLPNYWIGWDWTPGASFDEWIQTAHFLREDGEDKFVRL